MNKRILLIGCLLLGAYLAHAQLVIAGTVTDGQQEPLTGVTVLVLGTTNGSVTDIDGQFSVPARTATA